MIKHKEKKTIKINKKSASGRIVRLLVFLFFLPLLLGAGLWSEFEYQKANREGEEKIKRIVHKANPMDKSFYEDVYKFKKQEVDFDNKVIGGVIPHHLLAGDLIAEFFYNLEGMEYDSVVLIGPNHFGLGKEKIISSKADWETPYGVLEGDRDLLDKLVYLDEFQIEENIFEKEHAINSELAFIKKTFPKSKFLPLVLRDSVNANDAKKLALSLNNILREKNVLVLVSADFSHYKNSDQAQKDDKESIEVITNFDFKKVYDINVDSPASIYTLLKYSDIEETEFKLLNNSNSSLLVKNPKIQSTTSYVTGYFVKKTENLNSLPRSKDLLSLMFFGDLMIDRYVKTIIDKNGMDYIFGSLEKEGIFTGHDIVAANLEGAVADNGDHYLPQKAYDFSFHPDRVKELKKYNFNFFNIANNHLADQGDNGIIETEENLKNLDFNFLGCKNGVIDDCGVGFLDVKDQRIGVLSFSKVSKSVDEKKIIEIIKSLNENSDLVIVNVHWGIEYQHDQNKNQQDLAHKMIDAGVDIIIGHHPHVVQGIEEYNGKLIFYSLGNFVFDQYFSKDTQEELGVEIKVRENELEFILHPIVSNKMQLSLMKDGYKDEFLDNLSSWSRGSKEFKKSIKNSKIIIKK